MAIPPTLPNSPQAGTGRRIALKSTDELARCVAMAHQMSGKRISPAHFYRRPMSGGVQETFLSANHLGVWTLQQLRPFYWRLNRQQLLVAAVVHSVDEYNAGALAARVVVSWNSSRGEFSFSKRGQPSPAYSDRSNKNNPSHVGIDFVDIFDPDAERDFAETMAPVHPFQVIP